ncbi:hypothetical protein NE237_023399 [Protea cynaroides]|uniref:ACT domain-containing protein ACR n=1 Tax=Protea cynaroides TaxID=273540 RepID=A0A9Q0HF07_9MAGN|nr:hypothetical protein NE237_023399 [Protea cynaroides]
MESVYEPYFDPDFDSLIERMYPPRVCIDNDTRQDCTLVKVDSANKNGILLEMVQVLTELDLLISKSYISSDGGWFMDVFHVTDQLGHKLTDQSLIRYIQQALGAERRGGKASQVETCLGRIVRAKPVSSTEYTAIEITTMDRPGLLSEISAVLANLGCHVVSAVAWTHNCSAACILYVGDEVNGGGPIADPERVSQVEKQLDNVVGASACQLQQLGETRPVRLASPVGGRTQMERRLHQLMSALDGGDYDSWCDGMTSSSKDECRGTVRGRTTEVSVDIESCNEKGYLVLSVRSRDRPNLLFDTVCSLTDMKYVVFHANVSSKASLAVQEYYIRHLDGCTMDTETEKRRVTQCLVAAIERRAFHGLRLAICTRNRGGLLSEITRVFREHGLSVTRAEIGTRGERVIGYFHVTDVYGNDVDSKTVELVRREIGGAIVEVQNSPGSGRFNRASSFNTTTTTTTNTTSSSNSQERPRFSLGNLFWGLARTPFQQPRLH